MTPEQFTYWLQGHVETNGGKLPNATQWSIIKDHLQTVFIKVTLQYIPPTPAPVEPPFKWDSGPVCKSPLEGMTYC